MSKCAGCDQHNAVIYHNEDMYCHDCYDECLIESECYCDDDCGIVCHIHNHPILDEAIKYYDEWQKLK